MIFFISLVLFSLSSHSWIPPETFDSAYFEIEDEVISQIEQNSTNPEANYLDESTLSSILEDKLHKIHDDFHIPDYFKHNVEFWLKIYAKYANSQIVIHDRENLQLVYRVLDYKNIFDSDINKFSKENLKRRLTNEKIRNVRKILKTLETKDFKKLDHEEFEILKNIQSAGLKVPTKPVARAEFFKNLSKNLRTQSGQRDKVLQGLIASFEYIHFMKKMTKIFELPEEVLTIPFLESSFNIEAHSKVSAVGIWQFMDYTNNLFMPKVTKFIDYRKNPIISSIAAMHLLKENKFNLKRWDLAISAYNGGTKHLMRARSKFRKKKNVDLPYILENYQHNSLGFAVKNFYSEFLALAHTLAYNETVFPISGSNLKPKEAELNIYISKCKLKPSTFFSKIKTSAYDIKEINNHFKIKNRTYPRGSLVVSDISLTDKKYYKLSDEEIVKYIPKKYSNLIKNKKCNN